MTPWIEAKAAYHKILHELAHSEFSAHERSPTGAQRHVLNTERFEQAVLAQPQSLHDRLREELFGSGPLTPYLHDEGVTEILVNGPDRIFVEREGNIVTLEDHFFSELSYTEFLHRLSAEASIHTNLNRPFADGWWRGFRVHLIQPPLVLQCPHLSLRKHPECPWTLTKLGQHNWASSEQLSRIQNWVLNNDNILIVGATGTGKTSVLNACLQEVSPSDRVIVIEESREIHLPNTLSTKLLTRVDPHGVLTDYDQSHLLRQSLRMRPQRIVVGEIRGGEAKDYLMALSTGHRGGLSTLHADSAKQALLRLEMLVQLGAPQWNVKAVRQLIFLSLQKILVLKNENGIRRLDGAFRLASLEENGFLLEPIE